MSDRDYECNRELEELYPIFSVINECEDNKEYLDNKWVDLNNIYINEIKNAYNNNILPSHEAMLFGGAVVAEREPNNYFNTALTSGNIMWLNYLQKINHVEITQEIFDIALFHNLESVKWCVMQNKELKVNNIKGIKEDIVIWLVENDLYNFETPNRGLYYACKQGYLNLANYMIAKGAYDFNRGIYYACRGGNMEIVNLMIAKGAYDFNWGLDSACSSGHMEIVKYMVAKGVTDFNWGLKGACLGGHMEIVELMIAKGANNFNWGLNGACEGGHMEIVEYMIAKGANNFNWGLEGACYGGHVEIVELMLSYNPTNIEEYLNYAGKKEIKKLLIDYLK